MWHPLLGLTVDVKYKGVASFLWTTGGWKLTFGQWGVFPFSTISVKISGSNGGERNDHNSLVFGPILIIFGMEAKLAPRITPNEYATAMAIFGQRLHRGKWPVVPTHMNIL